MGVQQYYDAVTKILETVMNEEVGKIQQVGTLCADSILAGGLIHVFGTGHSHMLAEEMFFRAGGLLPVNPILDSGLMLHIDAPKSSRMERLTGLAEVLIEGESVKAGDVMFVFSNSGRNAAPIEMALEARKRGLQVVGVTSMSHTNSVSSRHPDNVKLHDVVDIVIDNHGVPGDAVVSLDGLPVQAAATSSVVGTFIVQAIVAEVATQIAQRGKQPPIIMSGNLDGAKEYNAKTLEAYKAQVGELRIRR
ncbi:SIS domain-containing protein [Alicyclobacillus sp. ALC3]|uniref:SIS domain-containing protein n=1 Tax=Alicyclobacillus sp. ALC3 TaxID=2796143 RepID=UPI0023787DB2|nr:SIS domain-containing protein [Alicyclobacillus sp. ALC3]WDL97728.1 SIS domain-containing protein [Alicyclobacillus sp. ALC3]